MTVREYIEQAIDRFLLYLPKWHVDNEQKERFVRRYERKFGGEEVPRCRMKILERLEDCGVMTPWTKEERLKWLDYASWHEAGHILGYFIVKCPPKHAYVNDKGGGKVIESLSADSLSDGMKRIVHVGGWAFERKHASVKLCKDSIGYGETRFKTSDWMILGQPTVDELESLSEKWFYHPEFRRHVKAIHDGLLMRGQLSKKQIMGLYERFLADEKARELAGKFISNT